ncbi:MAG: hypothetical protein K6G65_02685 [Lachnospiraceae bacterium]|nr:hypothetical protein [Lachnospiraceae bacterium]
MRKAIRFLAVLVFVIVLSACQSEKIAKEDNVTSDEISTQQENQVEKQVPEQSEQSEQLEQPEQSTDVDLTTLSSTMVYSEVYNMVMTPEDYIGKTVKMEGTFAVYENEENGKKYFACLISDATACCSQGIEFVLQGDAKYPEDYPKEGDNITVEGIFGTYDEEGTEYCQLENATLE